MDWQILINIGATCVLGVIGYFVKSVIDDQKEVASTLVADQKTAAKDLNDLRIKVAQDYVTHAALRDIKDSLIRIEGKIDQKVDKE